MTGDAAACPETCCGTAVAVGSELPVWLGPDRRGSLLVLGGLSGGRLVVHLLGDTSGAVHVVEQQAVAQAQEALALTADGTPEEWVEAWTSGHGGPLRLAEQTRAALAAARAR